MFPNSESIAHWYIIYLNRFRFLEISDCFKRFRDILINMKGLFMIIFMTFCVIYDNGAYNNI